MARKATKSVDETAIAVDTAVADISMAEEEVKEVVAKKNVKNRVPVEQLSDYDEIEVVSLVPNVSYKDSRTGDMYEWDDVGHVEIMTFETLKNMWRNNKGYFRDMCLKPEDDRVVNKFGLAKTYEKFEFLMDGDNYTKANIKNICSSISETPNGLKYSIVNKIKNLIVSGEVNDIHVIKTLSNHLDLDLFSLIE